MKYFNPSTMKKTLKWVIFLTLFSFALQVFAVFPCAFAYSPNDVVINEVAWAGTAGSSSDEWIELYNNTSQTINLTGWHIEDDGSTEYLITGGEIAPHGYFLIEDSEETVTGLSADAIIGLSLANAGDSLVLKDNTDAMIDTVNGSGLAWYAGNSTDKSTMERIDPKTKTDSASNWATATAGNGLKGRTGLAILGTPRSSNSNYGGGGASVFFDPSSGTYDTGDTAIFSVGVSDVTDLYSYGLEITYDPTVLDYVSSSEGDFLKAGGMGTSFLSALQNGTEGKLIVGNTRLLNPPQGIDGSGALFSLTFNVLGSSGAKTSLSFAPGSYISDSNADIPAQYSSAEVSVGEGTVSTVSNLTVKTGTARYSLELTWQGSEGSTYVVKKKLLNGNYFVLAETSNLSFVDNVKLIPGVSYSYQVVSVKDGVTSSPLEITGMDTRGLIGDLNRSDRVDGRDIENLARSYGSEYGDEEYDLQKDLNFDGVIDGKDLIKIGVNFGVTY